MKRLSISLAALAIAAVVFVFYICSYTNSPTEQVIITQFGQPQGNPITAPGLHFKTPFI